MRHRSFAQRSATSCERGPVRIKFYILGFQAQLQFWGDGRMQLRCAGGD